MKVTTLIHFIVLNLLLIAVGCVGTVQDASPPQNLQMTNPPTTFNFPGIVTARGISHNKVELEFFPASGSTVTYQLFVNNSTTPITIDPKSLLTVAGGKLLYTVTDLVPDREYKFKLTAKNTKTAAISNNENEAFARTFDNVVADFDGITKVSLLPGNTTGAINVDWIAPTMTGVFTANSYDPVHYEVTVISEVGGVANINNPTYGGTDKKIILVPTPPARANPLSNPSSIAIDGLAAGTKYFVQVRAINALYQNYAEDPAVTTIPVNREMNTRFLTIKTDSGSSLFDFRQDNVVLANAPGIDAFDKIDIFWQPGTGSYTGYRVFVRKYDGTGDPKVDDKLTEPTLISMTSAGNYYAISPAFTSKRASALENGSYYQVKVALCKVATCPVASADPNSAIISDLKTIQVKPTLAPFSGVNSIEPPGQYSMIDVVNLKFDAPLLGQGYANQMEFYCVNPLDKSQMVKFDGNNLITGSSITDCNGLYLDGTPPPIATYTSQKIRGLVTNGTKQYCFAATPAITGYGADIRLPTASMIVRCSYPEVFPPTIAQFPGLKNLCTINGASATVDWNLPTGGIYSGFKVFFREKTSANKFSFPDAISASPGYTASTSLSPTTLTYTISNLMPGRTYQVGVLAEVDLPAPQKDLYSEYNLNVIDCAMPLPIATFKGFTRIFAVGPKTDGRFPNDAVTKSLSASSYTYEAINADGIPYEVSMDNIGVPNITANFTPPPGRDYGLTFAAGFDGIADTSYGYAMGNSGIVSLAWEEVSMDFTDADTIFTANMPATPVARTGRNWGYKIYRSSDNKLTWQELTASNGAVMSMPYTYYPRPGAPSVTKKMAFFTDYSVKALSETHDAATGKDIERARTYYYKITPLFDGKPIRYTGGTNHVVRVSLPPPNMALVHRWMANRARCLEIDKTPDITANYSCKYNGIGAKPKGIPYRVGDTIMDQLGDLLIDRYELGCRYTRGDKTASPEVGSSKFDLNPGDQRSTQDPTYYPLFRGYRTVSETEDTTTPFRGCTGVTSATRGATGTSTDYPIGFTADYYHALQGDCIGAHYETIATGVCSANAFSLGEYNRVVITSPGAISQGGAYVVPDCSVTNDTFHPTNVWQKFTGYLAPNFLLQSEFLAVYYNTYRPNMTGTTTYSAPVEGPTTTSLSGSRTLHSSLFDGYGNSSCSINLASIASDGYMRPRWVSLNDLGTGNIRFKGAYPDLLGKTVSEITEVNATTAEPLTLYNGVDGDLTASNFKLPTANLRSSPRYRSTTRLAKIMTSNASKLPPLTNLNAQVANRICNNYFVQEGVASDNGTFAPNIQPVAKRTLRRAESVTASAWPESYPISKIQSVETAASSYLGACNSSGKGTAGAAVGKGSYLGTRTPVHTSTVSYTPLVTGSGAFNGTNTAPTGDHTNQCISKYGAQDMVGNVSEANSERIFCDYSQDAIYMGAVTGTWTGGQGAINQGAGGPEFQFFNTNIQRDDWAVMKQGSPLTGNTSFELRFRDGTSTRTDIKPWVKISVDSGYCSVVDDIPSRRSGVTDVFKDIATGFWTPMYLPGGAINNAIISRTQTDQDAVKDWRTGDGRFFDFGPQGMGAAFNHANTLALSLSGVTQTGDTAQSKYFNPWLGFPLKCQSGSCNDALLDTPNDNTSITTTYLNNNINPDPQVNDIPTITDFYVGNSQIFHQGVSDFQYPASGYQTMQVPTSNVSVAVPNILTAVIVDDPITMGNPTYVTKTFPTDFTPGSTFDYYRVIWDVPRGMDFGLTSGGRSNIAQSGRYTASIVQSSGLYYNSGDPTSGTRCAVMINQDP